MTGWFRPGRLLAGAATGTAICMSVLAGLQRGGWLAERLVWMAIGIVLVVGAHLLPALCRPAPVAVRYVGGLLWLGCMAATSYGHAMFFLMSQSHAGEVRISVVPVTYVLPHRDLTAVMADRATVMTALATANIRRCVGGCPALRRSRDSLAAQLDALDAEAGDIRRLQVVEDKNASRRDAVAKDPVTARLASLCGIDEARLDLFAGLTFSAVLEGTACLLWWVTLLPTSKTSTVTTRNAALAPAIHQPTSQTSVVTAPETEISKLTRDVAEGRVRPTVSCIRRHLHCSQAKAASLRKQIATPQM